MTSDHDEQPPEASRRAPVREQGQGGDDQHDRQTPTIQSYAHEPDAGERVDVADATTRHLAKLSGRHARARTARRAEEQPADGWPSARCARSATPTTCSRRRTTVNSTTMPSGVTFESVGRRPDRRARARGRRGRPQSASGPRRSARRDERGVQFPSPWQSIIPAAVAGVHQAGRHRGVRLAAPPTCAVAHPPMSARAGWSDDSDARRRPCDSTCPHQRTTIRNHDTP